MRIRLPRQAPRGAITVLAAIVLYIVVLLGVVAWAGIQEGADHALVSRLLGSAAYDASHRTSDGALVAGTLTLSCLDPSCTPVTCPVALARDPNGTTAPGQACSALQRGLAGAYGGTHARLDVAATLSATRVWVLAPGMHDPEDLARLYHYPTICLTTDTAIGILAQDGLSIHQHFHMCAQTVYS